MNQENNDVNLIYWRKRYSPNSPFFYWQMNGILSLERNFLYEEKRRYSNAIFGYFAWNLGNNILFCPQGIDVYSQREVEKRDIEKCLLIRKEYLQLLPKGL
ncbi:hypothetical protein J2T38_000815 [Neisseria perflava]|uniref:hypothetical protein n=1 Tax=Neisseria perflava TaxID=33053 RepID=UPI0020A08809|nr:hypothetical protein [Neisseria perflava]MCP1772001.1 hypothetical protein [Neisseria perflava]